MEKSEEVPSILISETVFLNGTQLLLTLNSDGTLRWVDVGNQKCLSLEKEVLGISLEGSRIILKCVVKTNNGGILFCFPSEESARRKLVIEVSSNESLHVWFQKLREFLDSLGNYCSSTYLVELCRDILVNLMNMGVN